jgi:hypothetical protein
MHVRTPYLPPLGAPLVCRLEDDGKEIVVEGVVAWQSETDGGGEFGVQFTALDSGSVEALKALCGLSPRAASGASGGQAPVAKKEEPALSTVPAGSPVKLHIDGLGAPMKARVKMGSSRKLQVGSNLEFLKVGKNLQIEDVDQGERRGARIDAVSVALDPETQVPQLVVVLRYDGEDRTPEPSVVGGEAAAHAAASERTVASARVSSDDHDDDDQTDDDDADAAAMRGPVDQFAASVGKSAMATSQKLATASGAAAKGIARLVQAGGARFVAARAASAGAKKRFTSPAPQAQTSREPRLRPQNGPAKGEEPASGPRKKTLVIAAASVLVVSAVAFGMAGRGKSDGAASARSGDSVALAPLGATTQSPSLSSTVTVPGATTPGVAVPGNAVPGSAVLTPGGPRPGVVANVPLFGPTTMATLEPAPLGPSPDEISAAAPRSSNPSSNEERMEDDDKGSAQDESFGDGDSKKKDRDGKDGDKDKSPEAVAEAVKPLGLGKMHMPVVYKLKLDKPGAALDGRSQGSGFTVTVPGRKVESGGSAITKRDDRISEVKTKNGPMGAVVTFVFRSKVPGYKVRLRKNYVEVFVSSPDSTH